MTILLLIIIYIAFISLGLPDSLLGVTWPIMHTEMSLDEGLAGLIAMVVSIGTIISSLLSSRLTRRFGTGKVTMVSVLMTAVALIGISYNYKLIGFIMLAIPLGLGAGAVDAALNNYVSLHYKSRHMSWLHCFWGVGAMSGPVIMSLYIMNNAGWRIGYKTVGIIQLVLVGILILSLPLWIKKSDKNIKIIDKPLEIKTRTHNIKGIKIVLLSFLFYCAIEFTVGLWGSSYLINVKGISVATAALWVSLFYGSITVGRLLSGFMTMRLSNKLLIRTGEITVLAGAIILILPLPDIFSMIGFIIIGLGCAPIYPSMLHSTSERFGEEQSSHIMGLQMAVTYIGGAFIPPLFGFIATRTTFTLFSYAILMFITIMLISSEGVNRKFRY